MNSSNLLALKIKAAESQRAYLHTLSTYHLNAMNGTDNSEPIRTHNEIVHLTNKLTTQLEILLKALQE